MIPTSTESATLRWMTRYWLATYALMTLSFLGFGALSIDLAQFFLANIKLIYEYGYLVLLDGALAQFFELLGSALLAVLFYIFFKTCESALVQRILAGRK